MVRLSLLLVALGLLVSSTARAVPPARTRATPRSSCHWLSMHAKFARIHWSARPHQVRHSGGAVTPHHPSGL